MKTPSLSGPEGRPAAAAWHAGFLKLVPHIRRHARVCLRDLASEAREEAIAEVVADALLAYVRLDALGKAGRAYPITLTRFAIGRFREGRLVGGQVNAEDVLSHRCRRRNGLVVKRLHRRDDRTGQWREVLLEDRRSTPAEIATVRLDFASWLATLPTRDRAVAEMLAVGETTARVALMFQISRGRVSQLRRELWENWRRFVGELTDLEVPLLANA